MSYIDGWAGRVRGAFLFFISEGSSIGGRPREMVASNYSKAA